jgi:hypothetical protein
MTTHTIRMSIGAVAVVFLVLAGVISTQAQQPSRVPPQAAADIDKLFATLYPVFSHSRCENCHGVVVEPPGDDQSVTKESHPAAEQDDPERGAECGSCHDADAVAKLWGLAPPHLRWAGLDADAVCAIQSTEARRRNTRVGSTSPQKEGSYLHHITHDPLIAQAWDGLAGGALTAAEKKATPPGNHGAFVTAVAEWVNAGAPCRSTAVVTQTESFSSSYSFAGPNPDGQTTVNETAARQLIVRRLRDGRVEADIDMSGSHTMVTITRIGACTSTTTTTEQWSRSSPRRVAADFKIATTGQAGYKISIVLPETKTMTTTRQRLQTTCGGPSLDTTDTVELEWPEWTIDIECPSTVPDGDVFCVPNEPQTLSAADGLIRRREVAITAESPWLRVSPAATNRADSGTPLSIDARTGWFVVMSPK